MKEIKNIRTFFKACCRLEKNTTMNLRGYDLLSKEEQVIFGVITAELGNIIGELENINPEKWNRDEK